MSTPTIFRWTCPQCGKEEMVMRPAVLEADADPKNAQAVKDETYFRVRCSGCGTEGDFLMNLLYADRERGFLVALQPDAEMPAPPVTGTWRALRLVHDGEDLADKVRALESPSMTVSLPLRNICSTGRSVRRFPQEVSWA